MTDDSPLTVRYRALSRKKVTAAFDGGRLSSDSSVMLPSLAERWRGLAKILAALIADRRDPAHATHAVEDVLKARMLAIASGHPDGNDFDWLRSDPAFKSCPCEGEDGMRAAARYGQRSVFAADHLALGKRADAVS
jgi:hypothetical protein